MPALSAKVPKALKNDFVKNILSTLFGSNEPIGALNGPLVRKESFVKKYNSWKGSPPREDIYSRLSVLFEEVRFENEFRPEFYIYSSPQANGFYFNEKLRIDPIEFDFLLDSFRETILGMGYINYTSDVRYTEKSTGIQRIDRHYLKPEIDRAAGKPREQKFGNILLELYFLDDKPQYLKVMVSVYSDQNYKEPEGFDVFVKNLFSVI